MVVRWTVTNRYLVLVVVIRPTPIRWSWSVVITIRGFTTTRPVLTSWVCYFAHHIPMEKLMNEYTLPEGMDGEGLRLMADVIGSSHLAEQLGAWADAIDPPEPESVVTDEMVLAYTRERYPEPELSPTTTEWRDLEAVERLGWLRDPELLKRDGKDLVAMLNLDDDDLRHIADENMRLSERLETVEGDVSHWVDQACAYRNERDALAKRLAMAEGLLRKAVCIEDPPYLSLGRHQMTPDEVEYLRSLDGEGDS